MTIVNAADLRSALDIRMGELAALLDDVAEALVRYPEEIVIADDVTGAGRSSSSGELVLKARMWPTIQEIDQLLANWRVLHDVKAGPGGRARTA